MGPSHGRCRPTRETDPPRRRAGDNGLRARRARRQDHGRGLGWEGQLHPPPRPHAAARAPIDFDLVAVNLDQGQPGYPAEVVEGHLRAVGVPYRMIARDTYSVVRRLVPEGKTTCAVCSRLRRGVLSVADFKMRCIKIAAANPRTILVEPLLLSALSSGRLKSIRAKL